MTGRSLIKRSSYDLSGDHLFRHDECYYYLKPTSAKLSGAEATPTCAAVGGAAAAEMAGSSRSAPPGGCPVAELLLWHGTKQWKLPRFANIFSVQRAGYLWMISVFLPAPWPEARFHKPVGETSWTRAPCHDLVAAGS